MILGWLGLYFVFLIPLISFAAAAYLIKFSTFDLIRPSDKNRFSTLDGLRGYLAILVFAHHCIIWYEYLKSDNWFSPEFAVYNNIGESSIALFFMITAFLYTNKFLNTKEQKVNWWVLYRSRVARILPLYFVSHVMVVIIVLIITKATLNESVYDFIINMLSWYKFKGPTPDLNGVKNTFLINAGVNWSLYWEWIFYFSLPWISLALGFRTSLWYLILATVIVISAFNSSLLYIPPFMVGIVTAFVIRNDFLVNIFKKNILGFIAFLLLIFEVTYFYSVHGWIQSLLLGIFFITIVVNNDFFKVFKVRASQFLGTISYSIYLLHGIVLFVSFRLIIGTNVAKTFSVFEYLMLNLAIAVFIVAVSALTYKFIEYPFLKKYHTTIRK